MPGGHNSAPEARNSTASGGCGRLLRLHRSVIYAVTPQLSLRGHTFFCLARKKYAKKRRRTRNSAYARKGVSFRCAFFRSSFRSPNALRATVESGFLSARYSICVVMFVPVEYLTYEIRNAFRYFEARRGRCPHRPAASGFQ